MKAAIHCSIAALLMLSLLSLSLQQNAKALDNMAHFHFSHIGLLGNSIILKVTGDNGAWQQWRWQVLPVLGGEFVRPLSTTWFHNGQSTIACATDTGNGRPLQPKCDTERINFAGGTDFYIDLGS